MAIEDILDEQALNKPRLPMQEPQLNRREHIQLVSSALKEIQETVFDVVVNNLPESFSINNLDEVKLHLKKELKESNKPLLEALKKLDKDIEFPSEIRVTNISDIVIPEQKDIKIPEFPSEIKLSQSDLDEIRKYFMRLGDVIKKSLHVSVDAPSVTVDVPPQIPPVVNVEPADFTPILDRLSPLQRLNTDIENPLNVTINNIGDLLDSFESLRKSTDKFNRNLVAFSGGPSQVTLRDAAGNIINPATSESPQSVGDGTATVATAGTAVQLSVSSIPCKYVIVNADIGAGIVCTVGASTTLATAGSMRGIVLIPGNDPVRIDISNVNLLYIDSVSNGGKVCYSYFN